MMKRDSRDSTWWRLAPVCVNLLLGVPAIIPLYSAWLLLTEYRSCALDNSGFESHCGDVSVIEGAGWARLSLVIFGGLGLLSVLAVDVLFPLATGKRLRQWLSASLVIPVPCLLAITAFVVFN
ncbi:hypothetical protein ACIA8E_05650 [Streptomyces sp. NPDC051664]|uniref:hypothetical protein n=1 Tax=Streptomyces sp. NPDC051664 TaxID=3365668 RepID=UPI003787A6BD